MRLRDKRVLVTGGSRGLGRAIAREFRREGARVGYTYSQNEAPEDGLRGFCVSVLDAPGTKAMVEELERAWGGLDILVNNAGVTQVLPLALMEEEDWDRVMDVNVKGAFLTSRAVLRGMIRRKAGSILNIGSLAGVRMIEAPVHYAASKAAIRGLSQALAKEVGRHGIRVNCLAPGILEDGVARNLPEHRLEQYRRHCALGRFGTLEEVARFAAFLVSDENSYMSGETILMDGGL